MAPSSSSDCLTYWLTLVCKASRLSSWSPWHWSSASWIPASPVPTPHSKEGAITLLSLTRRGWTTLMRNNAPPRLYNTRGKYPLTTQCCWSTFNYTFQQQVCKQNLPMHTLVSYVNWLDFIKNKLSQHCMGVNKYLYVSFDPQVAGHPVNHQEVCPFSCFTILLMLPKFSTLITANIIIIPFAVHIYTYHCVQGERSPFALRPALSA